MPQSTTPVRDPRQRARLFGPPALQRTAPPPPVAAVVTGSFSAGLGARVAEVEVLVDGVLITVHVCAGRVCGPLTRGAQAVRFLDRNRAAEAHAAALAAARDAELAGWIS